tara:strand:- start:1681 stop:2187 length:507 start_codon:yes stop_codon:yes gene_type:complete
MEWAIKLLELVAVTCAIVASLMAIVVMSAIVGKALKRTEVKTEKRIEIMSKQASEGITFNDIFMFMIAVPLVLLWVGFAGFVIHSGLNDAAVLEQIEGYTTLIAILGGPALLIIKDALDVWKQEQAEKTAFYKVKAQAVIDYNDHAQKQSQMIETKAQEQEHKMESKE